MAVVSVWRRILTIILAAAVAISPALACADFCPQPAAAAEQATDDAAMPGDCADTMKGQATKEAPSHDPDCQGCSNCPPIPSVKTPTLAHADAVTVAAPIIVSVKVLLSPIENYYAQERQRLTPPANGPPFHATPVTLKSNLRI